jgi:dolichol-phosphate mannosyltransferase
MSASTQQDGAAAGGEAAGSPGAVSVIVPAYHEAENLPLLIERVERVRAEHGLALELLIMDDDSRDGTEELVAALGKDWVRLVVRGHNRGLGPAVVEGLHAARHDVFVVMHADLSHPPEKIPDLLAALADNDFVIGSRYAPGGSGDPGRSTWRRLGETLDRWAARPFTAVRDPLSGFFALERRTFERGASALNPTGHRIALELLVKCGCRRVREVPVDCQGRQRGPGKRSLAEWLRYVQHLRRLFIYRYWTWSHLAQFLVVGASGVVVNLGVLTLLLCLGVAEAAAVAGGIGVSLLSNFALNRRFTFSYARQESLLRQFAGFLGACSLGAVANYVVTILLRPYLAPIQLAALVGIVAGTGLNFLCTRYLVFRFRADPRHFRAGA